MLLLKDDKLRIADHVKSVKTTLGLDKVKCIDGLTLIRKIRKVFPEFNYLRKPDAEMRGKKAYFEYGLHKNTVVFYETTFRSMNSGDPNGMKILYEEIGHFYLGHKHVRNHNDIRTGGEQHTQIIKDEAEAGYFAECFPNH